MINDKGLKQSKNQQEAKFNREMLMEREKRSKVISLLIMERRIVVDEQTQACFVKLMGNIFHDLNLQIGGFISCTIAAESRHQRELDMNEIEVSVQMQ